MHDEGLACQEFVELVTEYLEGTLSAAERQRFEEHLAGCTGCDNYLDQMRQTIDLTGTLSEQSIDPAVLDTFLGIFREWKQSPAANG